MPVLYFDIGDRVVGLSSEAAEELCARARRTPGGEDIAKLVETSGVFRSVRLSGAEQQKLREILDRWAVEVGVDHLRPGVREFLDAITGPAASA